MYAFVYLVTNPDGYSNNAWLLAGFNLFYLAQSVVLCMIMLVENIKMQKAIKRYYVWLVQDFMWRFQVIGAILFISQVMCLYIDIVSVLQALDRIGNCSLTDFNSCSKFEHWVEFAGRSLPTISVLLAYKPNDIFCEFNKFPEHCPRVSIMQYSRHLQTFRRTSTSGVLNPSSPGSSTIDTMEN